MKEYDYVFVSPTPTIVAYPSGGMNTFYRLSDYLTSKGSKVAIINLMTRYAVPKRFIRSKKEAEDMRHYPMLPGFASSLYMRAVQFLFSNLSILKFYQKIIGNDYDYSILKDVDMLFYDEEQVAEIKTKRIFATAWQSAYFVEDYMKKNPKTKGFYIIQEFEDSKAFSGDYSVYAKKTYGFKNLKKIVICKGLRDRFRKDRPSSLRLAIDLDLFKVKVNLNERDPFTVMMPLRGLATKGSRYALETVELLRAKSTKYKFLAYGNFKKKSVPSHIEYHYKPSNSELSRLYNRASIFICPSIIGAFTMPLLEAMAAGCATVTSDCIGINEYAKNNINSIIVPIKDSKAMAGAVELLAENPDLKKRIALNGIKTAKSFSYDALYKSFMSAIR